MAQQISVVTSGGSTSIHGTLQAAIEAAAKGSVIYLPGGGFPIDDSVKITKPLTIIGIGHKVKGENVDGYTTIQGNIFFNEGSSGSAIMGVYMTGNVKIGSDGKQVDNVLVRFCNLNAVEVNNNKCLGTVVNQNYIRSSSSFSAATGEFTNNVAHSVFDLDNGKICYNFFYYSRYYNYGYGCIKYCDNCSIIGNISRENYGYDGGNCLVSDNMALGGNMNGFSHLESII